MTEHERIQLDCFNDWLDDQEDAEMERQRILQAHYEIPLPEVVAQGMPNVSETP